MKQLIVAAGLIGILAGAFGPNLGGAPASAQIVVVPIEGDQPGRSACGGKGAHCSQCVYPWGCTWTCNGANSCASTNYQCTVSGGFCAGSSLSL